MIKQLVMAESQELTPVWLLLRWVMAQTNFVLWYQAWSYSRFAVSKEPLLEALTNCSPGD